MFATERRRLTAVAALAAICGVLMVLPGLSTLLSGPAAALLVLLLPGYLTMRALFGRRLELAEQVLLSLVLSLAIAMATGLLINYLPKGLTLQTWGAVLGLVSLLAGLAAILRGGWTLGLAPDGIPEAPGGGISAYAAPRPADAAAPDPALSDAAHRGGPSLQGRQTQVALLGVAGVLLVIAFTVARLGVAVQPEEGFTQFWMLPDASGQIAHVGFTNQEGHQTTYSVLLRVDAKTVSNLTDLVVSDGDTWLQDLTLPVHDTNPHSVTVLLYRSGDTLPYREAHSTVSLPFAAPARPASSPGASEAPTGVASPAPSQAP